MDAWGTRRNVGRLYLNTAHNKPDSTSSTASITTSGGSSQSSSNPMQSSSSKLRQLSRNNGTQNSSGSSQNVQSVSLSSPPSIAVEETENQNGTSSPVLVTKRQQVSLTTPHSSGIHPLHYTWVFWFMHRPPGSKVTNYESSMKKIAAFSSIEDFWAVYSHLRRPDHLPNISDYHLFRQGVRPIWEDEENISGGKWIVRLKKGVATRLWENLVIAIIGDQFDVGTEICGAVLSIRSSEDIISLWNKSANEGRSNLRIRDTMKRVLNLSADTIMEYRRHSLSLEQISNRKSHQPKGAHDGKENIKTEATAT